MTVVVSVRIFFFFPGGNYKRWEKSNCSIVLGGSFTVFYSLMFDQSKYHQEERQ